MFRQRKDNMRADKNSFALLDICRDTKREPARETHLLQRQIGMK